MVNSNFFRDTFKKRATDGAIGAPGGRLAYAYIRVSSAGQAEEGRSGLPRQIQNIHEAANLHGYSIPWDLVFADDASGFEFENRPELSRLRTEIASLNRQADVVVIENIDRLSRHADWHQGFLLDEMHKAGIEVIFHASYNSRVERAVMGAIAQDGMESSKRRMKAGTQHKAQSGRITAKRPAYGYKFVDSQGNDKGKNVSRDTHYAVREDQAAVVRSIFEAIADGKSLRAIAGVLNGLYPPPANCQTWEGSTISVIARNPLYKGEFHANRYQQVKVQKQRKDGTFVTVQKRIEHPIEERIIVSVPAIVSPELWDRANATFAKNKATAKKHPDNPYLLTGLVKCADCGHSYVGRTKKADRRYRCGSHMGISSANREAKGCSQPSVQCAKLDAAVWREVCKIIFEPNRLIEDMEAELKSGKNAHILSQIAYLDGELAGIDKEDKALWKSFVAEVFNEIEYKEKRDELKARRAKLTAERASLSKEVITEEQIAERRVHLLSLSLQARAAGYEPDSVEFNERQRLIKRYVDRVTLDARNETFRMVGIVSGTFALASTERRGNYSPYSGGDPNAGEEERAGGIGYSPKEGSGLSTSSYWMVPQVCYLPIA